MKKEIRILHVEDVPADVVMVNHELRKGGLAFRTRRVDSKEDFLHALERDPPDLILSDHGLRSIDGFTALAMARDKRPEVPFIFVTSALGEQLAIETFKSGATDCVLKHNLSKLVPAVQRALRDAVARANTKRNELALRESEERFRRLVEGVKDYAIFMLDEDGRVISWNSGAEWIHGYRAEEVTEQPFFLFYTPEDIEAGRPAADLRTAMVEGRFEAEGLRVGKGGKYFWAHVVITALRDSQGKLRGYAHVTRNITERKQAEVEIHRLNEVLERRVAERTAQFEAANAELEAFNYSVSHDLRAPLRHIALCAEMLQNQSHEKLDDEARAQLISIGDTARLMGNQIDGLLSFSRMGRVGMRCQPVQLATLVDEARHQLYPELKGRKVDWHIGDLAEVQGDPVMLRLVVLNLLSNALKYTRPRSQTRIEIGCAGGDKETVFFIRDNGVGFDMGDASKLFGVFQRLHSQDEFEGSGIGLALVRRIVHRHGGRAWAEGSVNQGATFFFSIPHGIHSSKEHE